MITRIALAAMLLGGCRQILGLNDLPPLSDGAVADTAPIDMAVVLPDAGPCQSISATCVGSTLRTCSTVGEMPTDTACPLGCSPTGDRCGVFAPTGGALVAGDLDADPNLAAISIPATTTTIDGDTGSITGIRAAGTGVVSGIEYQVRNNVAVFRFASLTMSGTVLLRGAKPIALVATGDIVSNAILDGRGTCFGTAPGPGGSPGSASNNPGAGGGSGNAAGGAGGGHGANGGNGGGNGTMSPATAGTAFGNPEITPLTGGGGGGGASSGAAGGGGGGALQLVGKTVTVSGGINNGGCGGLPSTNNNQAAGGGGAGGSILIEGISAHFSSTAILAVNGGGGGGADGGAAGENGRLGSTAALGGQSGGASGDGGNGGATANQAGASGGPGAGSGGGGGGGGGVGRIRINTFSGAAMIDTGAALSPPLGTTSTQGKIKIQ